MVDGAPAPEKGLSKEELGASALLRRCWLTADDATTRVVLGSWWRAQRRGREAVDEGRGGIVTVLREIEEGRSGGCDAIVVGDFSERSWMGRSFEQGKRRWWKRERCDWSAFSHSSGELLRCFLLFAQIQHCTS